MKKLSLMLSTLLALSGCSYSIVRNSPDNNELSPINKDAELLKYKSVSSIEAEDLLNDFFSFIDDHKYEAAYSMMTPDLQRRHPFQAWQNGYKDTLNHVIETAFCETNSCVLSITATENTKNDIRKTNYSLRYDLLKDDTGAIKIKNSTFIEQSLKEVVSEKQSATSDSLWLTSVIKIYCLDIETGAISQGSASVIHTEGIGLSNSHVKGSENAICKADFFNEHGSKDDIEYFITETLAEDTYLDYWIFSLDNHNPIQKLNLENCSTQQPAIGDSIRIVGYPAASGGNVTVTEGILSSFHEDGNHFVTSAKIDSGNSGGAAINVTKNCFLGIPSAGQRGLLESYGFILSSSLIEALHPSFFE